MDKKNTMLLTVIAVATLLVAVVGATFAYFSVTGANDNQTTAVNVKAEDIGSVALSNPTSTMNISVTAADMSLANAGTSKFYATTASDGSGYNTTATPYTVAEGKVGGGAATTKYKCTFTLNVAVTGDMKDALDAGDASIVFSGALTETSDLTTVAATRTVTFDNLTGPDATQNVQAYVVLNNRADADGVAGSGSQNDLAGKSLTITLSNTNFACDTVADTTTTP